MTSEKHKLFFIEKQFTTQEVFHFNILHITINIFCIKTLDVTDKFLHTKPSLLVKHDCKTISWKYMIKSQGLVVDSPQQKLIAIALN